MTPPAEKATARREPKYIVPAKDGWVPSLQLIRRLQREAKRLGLVSDWPTVCTLENHDLLLDCSHVTGEFGADLLAIKRDGKWSFITDREAINR